MTITTMKLPAGYAEIPAEEMFYLDGGATVANSSSMTTLTNVGYVFNYIARIFSSASSIITNIGSIITYIDKLSTLLGSFGK